MSLQLGCILQSMMSYPCCCPDSSCDVIVIAFGCKPDCYSGWHGSRVSDFQSTNYLRFLCGRNLQKGWLGWEKILEPFEKCCINYHLDGAEIDLGMWKRIDDLTSKHWQNRLLRLWMCQSFKDILSSLFYLYLPGFVCTRIIHDNSVYIDVSNTFFKKN